MGEDANEQDRHHETPLMHAADSQDIGSGHDRAAQLRVVRQLIAAKADINFAIPSGPLKGARAIHFALMKGDVAMVKAMLEYGADIRMGAAEPDGPQSPLEWAIQSEEPQMVAFVLALGTAMAGDLSRARNFFQRQRRMEEQRNIFPEDKYAEIARLLAAEPR